MPPPIIPLPASAVRFHLTPHRREAGVTIAEAIIGAAITTVAISGMCLASANCLKVARAHRELLIADHCLQQRTEQYGAASWTQITDPNGVSVLLAQAPVANAPALQDQTEKITIAAYPAVTPAVAPIVVVRSLDGTTNILSQPPAGFSLRNALAVRLDFQETWTSAQGRRVRIRESSSIIALGGLLH